MSKKIKKIILKKPKKEIKVSSYNILQEVKLGRHEIKSLQKSLANHRADTAQIVTILGLSLAKILERIRQLEKSYF